MASIVIQTLIKAVTLFIPGRRHDSSFLSLVQLVPKGKKGYSRCVCFRAQSTASVLLTLPTGRDRT